MSSLPKITVVTPSFNQAAFLESTIRSVLGQRYPALEYFVFDGGSTDGSVEVIKRYAGELAGWVSEADGGQANAINNAFTRATGNILCWINSDDFHMPDTLWRVASHLGPRVADPVVLHGSCMFFVDGLAQGRVQAPAPHNPLRLRHCDYFVQPSTFWTAAAWKRTGPLDGTMHFAFDWEWYLRAAAGGCEFQNVPEVLSAYRIHAAHKSGSGGERRRDEILSVMRRFASPEIVATYEWLRERQDLWPAMNRFRHVQRLGVPDHLAALFCPRLLLPPHCSDLKAVADCFDML